jgi:hypothetical protein
MISNRHITIFDLLIITATVAVFLSLGQIAVRFESNGLARFFLLSSVPVGLLIAGMKAIWGRDARYSTIVGVIACTLWGSALAVTFSHPGTLAELVDPGAYLFCNEFWFGFVIAQSIATGLLLVAIHFLVKFKIVE